ncbi:MAG: molybdenum cofactor guanylyltransferase [Pirellulaceae bacterium]
MQSPADVPAYILSGGKSTRFGSDKARVMVAGECQLLRLSRILRSSDHTVHVVAGSRDSYIELGIESIPDERQDEGPAMGLLTAMDHRVASQGEGWLLLVSVDQLIWQTTWFEDLAVAVQGSVKFVTFCREQDTRNSQFQPIPGLFHTSLREPLISRLASGKRSLKGLLERSDGLGVTCANNPSDWSFNDSAALERLLAVVSGLSDGGFE